MTTGRNLEPAKFGIGSPTQNKPDKFNQVTQKDASQTTGSVPDREVNSFHINSDVDSSRRSQHHTLGNARNQSAPGDHVHDGINGKRLGLYEMDPAGSKAIPSLVLTGSKGGNVALANLIALLKNFIDFTDTTT